MARKAYVLRTTIDGEAHTQAVVAATDRAALQAAHDILVDSEMNGDEYLKNLEDCGISTRKDLNDYWTAAGYDRVELLHVTTGK